MPKVIFNYDDRCRWGARRIQKIGYAVRRLVSDAVSTPDSQLNDADIDWVPMPYHPGALFDAPVSIEIETIGYPARKEKLTKQVLEKLKADILAIDEFLPDVPADKPLIWVKYVDSDGLHI